MVRHDPVLETIETYDNIATNYAQGYLDRSPWQPLYDYFLTNLHGKKILDVGSGPGHDAQVFSESGLNVIGIDLSEKLLKIASERVKNAQFLKMDMRRLDFPNKSFDGVWAMASVQHLPKSSVAQALSEFRRVIKDDGLLYVSVTIGDGERFETKDRYQGSRKYFAYYSRNEIISILGNNGFKLCHEVSDDTRHKFWNLFARPILAK